MTQGEIAEIIRQRHLPPKWVFLENVRTRTGYSTTYGEDLDSQRYIDCFAMCLWKSGNYQRIAYEIKSTRTDWLSELENPIKRAQAFLLSHQFWFVLAPGVIEKPGSWWKKLGGAGIMEVTSGLTLYVHSPATKRQPFPMPETFVASLLRSACKINGVENDP